MNFWALLICLLSLILSLFAQETCATSDQVTRMQMQNQIDIDNINARINSLENKTLSSDQGIILSVQADLQKTKTEINSNTLQTANYIINETLMRVIVSLFATSAFLVSLVMLVIYYRL